MTQALALCATVSFAMTGCINAADSRPPSILLVTIDTLRADRLSADGPMPHLWALSRKGTLFLNAHSQIPLTLPSHATILSGQCLRQHGVLDNIGYALGDETPTVAQELSAAGYDTAAFVGGYPLTRSFGLARGFDVYDDRMTRTPPRARSGHTERRAVEVVDAALEWVRIRADSPFFVWVHLFDPHDPYEAPEPFAGRHDHAYDDEVAYADRQLGRLIDEIGRLHPTPFWTIVTADHGESLGEHGEPTHGIFVYESTLHIPLVVVPPQGTPPRTVESPVSSLDIAPTLLEAAGRPSSAQQGRSLIPTVLQTASRLPATSPLYIESSHGRRKYGWAGLSGLLDWPLKFISAPRPEVYDLRSDPLETNNIAAESDVVSLEGRLRALGTTVPSAARRTVSEEALERLAALGYTGPATAIIEDDDSLHHHDRPDPKDRIHALEPLDRGLSALVAERPREARRELSLALERDPDNLVALNNLGILALERGDLYRAAKLFARGLALGKTSEHLANNLGMVRSRQGRHRQAAEAYRLALAGRPGFTAARYNLALALYRQGLPEQALRELERVRTEDPDFPDLEHTVLEITAAAADER